MVATHFPMNCSPYESRLPGALDTSRHEIMCVDNSKAHIVSLYTKTTACHIMDLSYNNITLDKKEQEYKSIGKKMKSFVLSLSMFLNSCETFSSTDNPNASGNAQEYVVNLYISKTNLFVGGIHM